MKIHNNKGFSLVELMISSFISIVILAGVIQLTLASSSSNVFQNQIAQIQENLRFTVNEISTQAKNSHFYPAACDGNTKIANLLWSDSISKTPIINMGLGLNVLESNKRSEYVYKKLNKAYNGSDILYIGVLNTHTQYQSNDFKIIEGRWMLDDYYERPKERVMLAMNENCHQAVVFLADFNNTTNTTNKRDINEVAIKKIGNSVQSMQNCSRYVFGDFYCDANDSSKLNGYQLPTRVDNNIKLYPISQNYYYVAPSTQKDNNGEYYPALFHNSQELVQGVEKMTVYLGLDIDGDNVPNQYLRAEKINEKKWVNVKSIRVNITMRSLERVSYVKGLDNDQYIRKDFTQTIFLRN